MAEMKVMKEMQKEKGDFRSSYNEPIKISRLLP